jgi:hypothetical protein
MSGLAYVRPRKISLRLHPEYSEKWVQNIVADDPSILGLGDLTLKDRERIQPRAGRLDLLLQDNETRKRFEVELQLGATDETHIIRTIEYWDLERKRYPQYEHCAVLIAEDITSRFLNVISLFNSHIPFIALQMQAFQVGQQISLMFTKVLDEFSRGLSDEDDDAGIVQTDRRYWEGKTTKELLSVADSVLETIKSFSSAFQLNYNKNYIGLVNTSASSCNFVNFLPRQKTMWMCFKVQFSEEIQNKLVESGFDDAHYNQRWKEFRFSINRETFEKNKEIILIFCKMAHDAYFDL